MHISVVIPTCERKGRLLSLLQNLDRSSCLVDEVIIVDSGNDKLLPADYSRFTNLNIQYVLSERSVCIQRNIGIRLAVSPWIFLCDDDIEIPADYLQQLVIHVNKYPETGAVSGLWLQKENSGWKATYPVDSARMLFWKFIFQLGIWGEINCAGHNTVTRKIKQYYKGKGNHISKAGWPVNIDFTGEYAICPVYSLGASLVKKEWLVQSPYDEVLDPHGIGDNYGVAVDFPGPGIHIVNDVFVYHHKEPVNRLKESLQYYRRTLALDYFIRTKPRLKHINKYRVLWSLTGNLLSFLWVRDGVMVKAGYKAISKIILNRNPYFMAGKAKRKIAEPML
ncbi:MAG: glycosyltransferase family 2 protein [Chitinophagaceae bacterium]|nr:glycosyltransferase family 2 protein [Chitinophagaceae bacterium]